MLFKAGSKELLTKLKDENFNQISGGIVKLAGKFYLTSAGEVNHLYNSRIAECGSNTIKINELLAERNLKLNEIRTNGSTLLATRYYTYFRDNPAYRQSFENAQANEGTVY